MSAGKKTKPQTTSSIDDHSPTASVSELHTTAIELIDNVEIIMDDDDDDKSVHDETKHELVHDDHKHEFHKYDFNPMMANATISAGSNISNFPTFRSEFNSAHRSYLHLKPPSRQSSPPSPETSIRTHDIYLQTTDNFTSLELYDYVESIIMGHMSHSTESDPSNIQHIKGALKHLKFLLVSYHKSQSAIIIEPTSLQNNKKEFIINEKTKKKLSDFAKMQLHPQQNGKLKWCTHSTRSLWNVFLPSSTLLHHPSYRIDPEKYCGLLRGSVRQDWNTIETDDDEHRNWEELKPHWFELFFDLMFVAAIVHISHEVANAYDHFDSPFSDFWIFLLSVFCQFGLLTLCWLEQVLYHSRFRMTQAGDGFLRFLYMALVLAMGLGIGHNNIANQAFLASYMLAKCVMAAMFIKSSLIPRSFNHSIYMIIENVISIIAVIMIEVFMTGHYEIAYFGLFSYSFLHIIVLVFSSYIRNKGINIPINVPHVAERMGAFVLIILGETIISIMVQHVEATRKGMVIAYSITMCFFLIVYSIGKLYFESQPTEYELHHHRRSHAMSSSVWRARIWKWCHFLLFFGLLGLGLGAKITTHELGHYDGHDPILVFLPGISCVLVCACINVIRLTHPFDYSDKHPHLVIGVWCLRVVCIAVMFAILFAWESVHHFVIIAVYVISFVIQIVVDFEAKHRLVITKANDKRKSHEYYQAGQRDLDEMDENDPNINNFYGGGSPNVSTIRSVELSFMGSF